MNGNAFAFNCWWHNTRTTMWGCSKIAENQWAIGWWTRGGR